MGGEDFINMRRVSLTTEQLSEQFDKSVSQITWGITLVLMFRSVGSVVFGIAADRWGKYISVTYPSRN